MAAADHRKALFRSEIGRLRQFADRLLARVDKVGVFVALEGEGTDAEHAVFGLPRHRHPLRHMIRYGHRNADSVVYVKGVSLPLRRPPDPTISHQNAQGGEKGCSYMW